MNAQTDPTVFDADLRAISDLVKKLAGLHLPETKSAFVKSRVQRRMKALGMATLKDYNTFVMSGSGEAQAEHGFLVAALTTNVTHFFREKHHFDLLTETFENSPKTGFRIWSAGCSAGHEPYSAALTLINQSKDYKSLTNVKILATDIDMNMLAKGNEGKYERSSINAEHASLFDGSITQINDQEFAFNERVKRMISFKRLNLIGDWPITKRFDFIFCRNVAIYFDATTQEKLFRQFAKFLNPNGVLCVGHSERAPVAPTGPYISKGLTSYRLAK